MKRTTSAKKSPGRAEQEERRAPIEVLAQIAAEEIRQRGADVDAPGVDAERGGPPVGREVVRDQRVGGRAARRLPHADPDARQRELREVAGEPRRHRHGAPDREADGDDGAAVAAIGPARDGNAREGVEEREREADQEPHGRVGYAELGLDRPDEDREHLAIDEVDDVDHEEDREDVVGVARRELLDRCVCHRRGDRPCLVLR